MIMLIFQLFTLTISLTVLQDIHFVIILFKQNLLKRCHQDWHYIHIEDLLQVRESSLRH